MKSLTGYSNYYDDFKKHFIKILNYIFDINELYLYVDGDGMPRLFDKIWENLEDLSNIINKEENIIYKMSTKLYLTHPQSKEWIDKKYKNGSGRRLSISTITTHEKKYIEKYIKEIGEEIEDIKAEFYPKNNSYYE